jgi:DNA-binding LacI/PurR family transcriptional regulator
MRGNEGKPRDVARRPTLKMLADHLGLSTATVSVVISGAPTAATIAEPTKERIWKAVEKFGYRPNALARYLHTKRTYSVGVLVPDIGDEYSASLVSGIETRLAKDGYFFFVVSHRGAPDLIENSPNTLLDRAVEGLIFINTPLKRALPVPVVAISDITEAPGVTRIVIDNKRAAMMILEHLVKLGHKKIAFFKGPPGNGDTQDRWASLSRVAWEMGIKISSELTVQLRSVQNNKMSMSDSGYECAKKLLASQREFTALVAFNDVSAVGAIRAFQDRGLRVPRDISVTGFDDVLPAAFSIPRLTTIRQPLPYMGQLAATTLLESITSGKRYPEEVLIYPELIVRESTAIAKKSK